MQIKAGEFMEVRWKGSGTRMTIQKIDISTYGETKGRDATTVSMKNGERMTIDLPYDEFRQQMLSSKATTRADRDK